MVPPALMVTSDRYGTIGVSFTYIALLYIVAFCFLGSVVIGEVIATDRGALGAWIRLRALTPNHRSRGGSG